MNRRKKNDDSEQNAHETSIGRQFWVLVKTGVSQGEKSLMQTTRRDVFRSALVAGLTAGLPSIVGATPTSSADLKARYAKLDAAASQPVFKRALFPEPAIIQTVELLHCGKSWLCRVRTEDGAKGISVSNSQQMEVLYPIFAKRIAPYFIGKDARDLEA
jgi:hypothetical protein